MSDSDKALLAAMAMRAKKNAIDQGKGMSIAAKVKALSEAGFSDDEIDKILAVEAAQPAASQDEHAAATEEYNEQVDETLKFAKWHTAFLLVIIIGAIGIMLSPSKHLTDNVPIAIAWSFVGFVILLAVNIPFTFKKAGYFLKR